MEFEKALNESYKRYKIVYNGTQPRYKINDPNPHVLCLDNNYNVDGNGRSMLGINLNYYKGDLKKLINDINQADNDSGFMGFEMVAKIKSNLSKDKDKTNEWIASRRIKRYKNFIDNFPYLGKFIRRYKVDGIQSKTIERKKK